MAVAFTMHFKDGTLEQYDEVIRRMGFVPNGLGAHDGGVFHWVAKVDDGILVTDVWKSDEQFNRFAEEQIGPITAAVGIGSPQITRYEVHNTLGRPDAFA